MIGKVLNWVERYWDEKTDREICRIKNEELKEFCWRNNLGFYPELAKKLPPFAKEVNEHIEQKAREDLPKSQFEGKYNFRDLSSLIEIQGLMGYNGSLSEIDYTVASSEMVRFERTSSYSFQITSEVKSSLLSPDKIAKAEVVIDWHSHPHGFGVFSEGDMFSFDRIRKELLKDKPTFYVLFRPEKNCSYWHELKNF